MNNKWKSIFKNKKIKILMASAFGAVLIAAGSVTAVLLASRNNKKSTTQGGIMKLISSRSIDSVEQYKNTLADKIAAATYWGEIDQGIAPSLAQRDVMNNVGVFLSRAKKTTDPKILKEKNLSASLSLYSTLKSETQKLGVDVVDDWSWSNVMLPAIKQQLEGPNISQQEHDDIIAFAQGLYNVDAKNLVSDTGFMFDLVTGLQSRFKDVFDSKGWDFIHCPFDLYYAYMYTQQCINNKTLAPSVQSSDSFAGLLVPYTGSGYSVGSVINDNDLSTLLSYRYDISFGKILTKPNFDYSNPPVPKTDSYITTGLTKNTPMKGYSDAAGTNYGVDEIFPGYKIHAKISSFDGSTDERTAKIGLSLGISNTQTDPQSDHIVWFADIFQKDAKVNLSKVLEVDLPITTLKYKRYIAYHTFYTGDNDVVVPAEDYDVNDNVAFKNTLPLDPDGNVCGRYIENLIGPYFPGSALMDFNLTDVSIPYIKICGQGILPPSDTKTEHGDEELCLKVVDARTDYDNPGILAHWIRRDHQGNDVYDYKWKVTGKEYDNIWIYTPYSAADLQILTSADELCSAALTYNNLIDNYNQLNDDEARQTIHNANIQLAIDGSINGLMLAAEIAAAIYTWASSGTRTKVAIQIALDALLVTACMAFDGTTLHNAEKWEDGYKKFQEICQPLLHLSDPNMPDNEEDVKVINKLAADGAIGLFDSLEFVSPIYKIQEATADLNSVTDKITTTFKTFMEQIAENFMGDKQKDGRTFMEKVKDLINGIDTKCVGGGTQYIGWLLFSVEFSVPFLKFFKPLRRVFGEVPLANVIKQAYDKFQASRTVPTDPMNGALTDAREAVDQFEASAPAATSIRNNPSMIIEADAEQARRDQLNQITERLQQNDGSLNQIERDIDSLDYQLHNNWSGTVRDSAGVLRDEATGEIIQPGSRIYDQVNDAEAAIRRTFYSTSDRANAEQAIAQLRRYQTDYAQRIANDHRELSRINQDMQNAAREAEQEGRAEPISQRVEAGDGDRTFEQLSLTGDDAARAAQATLQAAANANAAGAPEAEPATAAAMEADAAARVPSNMQGSEIISGANPLGAFDRAAFP